MTKWFAYFKDKNKLPCFRLITSKDLPTAEMMVIELAARDKSECVGIIVAPQSYQQ